MYVLSNTIKLSIGHVVSDRGIHTDPEKVRAIKDMPPPTDITGIRRFMGMVSYYRRFITNCSIISHPLTELTKKGVRFEWNQKRQNAFEELKNQLATAPILSCPDFTHTFYLQTDASDVGLGVVLFQRTEEGEKVVAYASRTLNKAEKNYTTTEKECLGVVWGIQKMKAYLEGYHFVVITDHLSLKWLRKIDSPSGRLARWALLLQ